MAEEKKSVTMDEVVALCKNRGFIFPGSDIYGGLANSWDYGPLGVELLNNIKKAFWDFFVYGRNDIVGLDSAILMNPKVWEASGHVVNFSDPLVDCRECKSRFRGDKLIEEKFQCPLPTLVQSIKGILKDFSSMSGPDPWFKMKEAYNESKGEVFQSKMIFILLNCPSQQVISVIQGRGIDLGIPQDIKIHGNIQCPSCGKTEWTEPKQFNLMFRTWQGVTEESSAEIYLRPETAQGIFVNFINAQRTSRKKLPFGIAQIGKAFRNEITPGNFIFRTREFEQMEIEYFFDPEKNPWEELWKEWKQEVWKFMTEIIGLKNDLLRLRDHDPDELSHYSKGTTDIEYQFPFGWGELCAAGAYRGNYDLSQHQTHSGENLEYRDEETGKKILPHVIEPSIGAGRTLLAVLLDAYTVEEVSEGDTRIVLKFSPRLAPVKVAVFPLMKKDGLAEKAQEVKKMLRSFGNIEYDESGSIGKRYRRHDEIGTPACVTVDYDTLQDGTVTVRDRDSMEQERVKISDLEEFLRKKYF